MEFFFIHEMFLHFLLFLTKRLNSQDTVAFVGNNSHCRTGSSEESPDTDTVASLFLFSPQ